MHRSEARELVECIECGATIAPERDRAFPITDDAYMCFECAVSRGGIYDEDQDEWTSPPDLRGVPGLPTTGGPGERRPHA